MLFKTVRFGPKIVYVVEAHHCVLIPWAIERRKLAAAPNLITLDHHTDTRPAFLGYAFGAQSEGTEEERRGKREAMCEELNWSNDDALERAVLKLRNDEHIDAATTAGILNCAYIIQLCNHSGTLSVQEREYFERKYGTFPWKEDVDPPSRPFTYELPKNRIFELGSICAIGCDKSPHDDDCLKKHYDQVLETVYLEDHLFRASEMARSTGLSSIGQGPYLLDLDLDYFHTEAAVRPTDPAAFHNLIRNATAITIATEPMFVANMKLEGEDIDADLLLDQVLQHVAAACA